MSTMTTIQQQEEQLEFVKKATACFLSNPGCSTYTESGRIFPGELFAMRWGMGNDCVLVFRIDGDFKPIIFQQAIKVVVS